jgi:hypothetical protein
VRDIERHHGVDHSNPVLCRRSARNSSRWSVSRGCINGLSHVGTKPGVRALHCDGSSPASNVEIQRRPDPVASPLHSTHHHAALFFVVDVAPSWAPGAAVPVPRVFWRALFTEIAEALAASANNVIAAIHEVNRKVASWTVLVIDATLLASHAGGIEPGEPCGPGFHRGPLPEQACEHLRLQDGSKVFNSKDVGAPFRRPVVVEFERCLEEGKDAAAAVEFSADVLEGLMRWTGESIDAGVALPGSLVGGVEGKWRSHVVLIRLWVGC